MMSLRPLFVRLSFASSRLARFGAAAGFLSLAALSGATLRAQTAAAPGSLDTDFAGSLTQITAYAVAVDNQQRVIVGGDNFTLARFLPSGTIDPNFTLATFGNNGRIIFGLAVDVNDNIIVVGKFNRGGTGMNAENITRLTNAGALDAPFNPGIGTNDTIVTLALLPVTIDGAPSEKIYVGGLFTAYNDQPRGRFARLNEDGTLDPTFDPALSFDRDVYAIGLDRDVATGALNGAAYVGGSFDNVNGSSRAKLARINADGSVDTSFNPDINDSVFAAVVQPDGKIVIGGQFQQVNGVEALGLARLNPDGSLDATFDAGVTENDNNSVPPTAVYSLALQANDRILVGGNFLKLNGNSHRFLGRLNADGSADESFNSGTNVANRVESLAIVPGDFTAGTVDRVYAAQFVSKRINGAYPFVTVRLFGDPQPAPTPTVAIFERIPNGKAEYFLVTRSSGDLTQPLTVYYELLKPNKAGRAISGTDYFALPGSITIPANKLKARINVVPRQGGASGSVGLKLVEPPAGSVYDIDPDAPKANIQISAVK